MMTIEEAREIGFREGWAACMRRKERKQSIGMPVANMIIDEICEFYGAHRWSITERCRKRARIRMRGMAVCLIRRYTVLTLKQIGNIFGYDHSTAINAIESTEKLLKENAVIRFDFAAIDQKIQEKLKQKIC